MVKDWLCIGSITCGILFHKINFEADDVLWDLEGSKGRWTPCTVRQTGKRRSQHFTEPSWRTQPRSRHTTAAAASEMASDAQSEIFNFMSVSSNTGFSNVLRLHRLPSAKKIADSI